MAKVIELILHHLIESVNCLIAKWKLWRYKIDFGNLAQDLVCFSLFQFIK